MKNKSARHPYSPAKGLLYIFLGRLLIATGVLIWLANVFFQANQGISIRHFYPGLIDALIILAVGYIGLKTARRGKKLRVLPGELLLKQDIRAPILYLRSFAAGGSETTPFTASSTGIGMFGVTPVLETPTDEEDLVSIFSKVGPFVAIGNSDENLPEIVASRLYVGNDDWQRVVTDLARKARLVILRVGTSDGLLREIENVVKNCPPEKVLFYLAFRQEPQSLKSETNQKPRPYDEFRRLANPRMPHPLPEEIGRSRFMIFRQGWVPERVEPLSPVQQSSGRSITGGQANNLRRELAPVFERLESKPKSSLVTAGWSILRIFLGLLIAIPIFFLLGLFATIVAGH